LTTFTVLADGTLAQDKPLTQSVTRALRDNPLAIAEGASGAPAIRGVNPSTVMTVPTAVASIVITDLPAADLIEFELLRLRPVTNAAVLYAQVSKDNGANWVSGYLYAKSISEISTGGSAAGANEGAYISSEVKVSQVSGGVGNGGGSHLNGVFNLFNNGSTAHFKGMTWAVTHSNGATGGTAVVNGGGTISGVATGDPINAVKFFFSTGNIAAGQITVRSKRTAVAN
jgi:hypothetical protein